MDNRENLWTRRSNTSKLSLSMSHSESHGDKADAPQRTFSASKRYAGDSSHGGRNPFNAIPPTTPGGLASPTTAGGSSAFGLGSGAFASFGSATKTPKTPGTTFDFKSAAMSAVPAPATPSEKKDKPVHKAVSSTRKDSISTPTIPEDTTTASAPLDPDAAWPLKSTWVVWYRPPTPKNTDYEKSIVAIIRFGTAQEFWKVFVHLKKPSTLPSVSDYHVFKEGIRPVWEDEENKRGGKWIMRLKKGVADRYWEELLMALVGDQFMEAREEVCGFVLSVRSGEDVLSIWTKNDGGRNIKIRETVKRVLELPEGTNIVWRSHDDSIAQRSAIDQARYEKNLQGHEKRRVTSTDESQRDKSTAGS
ncbi:IF4E-domain-containing protein [Cucurbitaria berberidis CBS 394.84]|uniref:IF4E-domain-containing protein n=1 Tax=Cucurbitaria berberidis CBS 394.84 TaxID=1168544 RepID=A0A9P4GM49_9PLEO|nr:IF4E-domain-containing protein [Cucurbitaria berberidis CBS 394.84]KAF1847719.1 IF4E-domain-containing protein [Cucurbitaria berberidis CBS 394.84]